MWPRWNWERNAIQDSGGKTRQVWKYVRYQVTEGDYFFVSVDKLHDLKYRLDQPRALHHQIICVKSDMIKLKEEVEKALIRMDYMLLDEFLLYNSSFMKISIPDEDEKV